MNLVQILSEEQRHTLHVFDGESIGEPLWEAKWTLQPHMSPNRVQTHVPSAFALDGSTLYMGTSDGRIHTIDVRSGEHLETFGNREGMVYDEIRPVPIRALALFGGQVYDASAAGLFRTTSNELIDERSIGSLEVHGDKLLMVPYGVNHAAKRKEEELVVVHEGITYVGGLHSARRFFDDLRESKAGNLIDAFSKQVVFPNVRPFDGSGCSPGDHVINNGSVYMHHGDYPAERIDISSFPGGAVQKTISIWSSDNFIPFKNDMYDVRWIGNEEDKQGPFMRKAVMPSDTGVEYKNKWMRKALYVVPPRTEVTGYAAERDSLLISVYDSMAKKSSIIDLMADGKPVLETDGVLALHKPIGG